MSKRLLFILLLVSLAFNLAVLGMFVFTSVCHRPICPPTPFMHGRGNGRGLHMQRNMLIPPIDRERLRPLNQDFRAARAQFIQTLAQEKFSEADANAALEKSLHNQDALERAIGKNLIELRKTLSPTQAKAYFGNLEAGRRHMRFFENDGQPQPPESCPPPQ